jgi:hypothetical protein
MHRSFPGEQIYRLKRPGKEKKIKAVIEGRRAFAIFIYGFST